MSKKRRRCTYCSELKDDVIGGLCSDCESENYVWCEICKEMQPQDQLCRHLSYIDGLHWGAGSNEVKHEDHKESVFTVLTKVRKCVHVIRRAVEKKKLHLMFGGPMIGRGWLDCWVGSPECNIGDEFTKDLESYEERAMSIGVAWLMSLYPEFHQNLVDLTLSWIDEWQRHHNRHQMLMLFQGKHRYQRDLIRNAEVARRALRIAPVVAGWIDHSGTYVVACRDTQTGRSLDRYTVYGPGAPTEGPSSWSSRWPDGFELGFPHQNSMIFNRPFDTADIRKEAAAMIPIGVG